MSDRTRELAELRRDLLHLPPADRVEAILSAPRPGELVRALPAQELYLTIADAGVDASLALLPLASRHQLDFLLDIGAWSGDELDVERLADWLAAFGEADPGLVARWLLEGDEPTVVLALSRLLRVYKLDESTSEDRWPPDRPVPTLDGVYFVEPDEEVSQGSLTALWSGLARLRERSRPAYEALLEQVLWLVPAEQEEAVWTGRWSRLAERGFPEPDESLQVWAAGPEADLGRRAEAARLLVERSGDRRFERPSPAAAGRALTQVRAETHPRLAAAVRHMSDDRVEQLAHDLIRLGNRYAVAGGGDLGEPATHAAGLATAASHVNLGLCELAGADDARLAVILSDRPLIDVCRLGVGAVEERARHARHLVTSGWLSRVHLARERLEPALGEPLDGLTEPRPRFTAGGIDRPFRDPGDLEIIDEALASIDAIGAFLEDTLALGEDELPELTPLPAGRAGPDDVEWTHVALTSIARSALEGGVRP
ncbi:MAG: DUF6178 family protein, partial [Acidobacteriota bacterium]|nr:DUF6178 family protein [Acidobacteriota bacterium]